MSLNWINARQAKMPSMRPKQPPKFHREISEMVGKNVPVNDPKLIKVVVMHKQRAGKDDSDSKADNYLKDPEFIKDVKQAFS